MAGGVDEPGPAHAELPSPTVHELDELPLVSRQVVGQRPGGVVCGPQHRRREKVLDAHPVAGIKPQPGPRLARRRLGHRCGLLKPAAFDGEKGGHDLGEAGRGERPVRIVGPQDGPVEPEKVRRGQGGEGIGPLRFGSRGSGQEQGADDRTADDTGEAAAGAGDRGPHPSYQLNSRLILSFVSTAVSRADFSFSRCWAV